MREGERERGWVGARVQSDPPRFVRPRARLYGDKTVSTVAQMAIVDNGEHRRGWWKSDETENRLLMSLRNELNDPRATTRRSLRDIE